MFYQGFNLLLKWSFSLNQANYSHRIVSINPSGTHVAAVATKASDPSYWINIFQTSDGRLVKSAISVFDIAIMAF